MKKQMITAEVVSQNRVTDDIYSMVLKAGEIAKEAVPGQFVSLYSADGSRLLPRPISLCEVNKNKGTIRLVYRVVGVGTAEFSSYRSGDVVQVLGPLGNGFNLECKEPVLMGGGIGIPPMLELAKQLSERLDSLFRAARKQPGK